MSQPISYQTLNEILTSIEDKEGIIHGEIAYISGSDVLVFPQVNIFDHIEYVISKKQGHWRCGEVYDYLSEIGDEASEKKSYKPSKEDIWILSSQVDIIWDAECDKISRVELGIILLLKEAYLSYGNLKCKFKQQLGIASPKIEREIIEWEYNEREADDRELPIYNCLCPLEE